jgi:hypothetical protein
VVDTYDGPFKERGAPCALPRLLNVLFVLTAGCLLLFTLDDSHGGLVGDLCLFVVASLLLAVAGTGWHMRGRGATVNPSNASSTRSAD